MVRYNRRRYRKNYRKRGSNTLSKYNIYMNKSARSQAKQISTLNRKINRIARRDKPEIKIYTEQAKTFVLASATEDQENTYLVVRQSLPVQGVSDGQYIGDKLKMLNFCVSFNAEYVTTYPSAMYASLRLIVLQRKVLDSTTEASPKIKDILEYNVYQQADQELLQVSSPFEKGFSKQWRVLYDKNWLLTYNNKPVINKRLYIKVPSRYSSLRTVDPNGNATTQNLCYFMFISSGLKWKTEDVNSNINVTWGYKLAYTDA